MEKEIRLGDLIQDTITGFKGIAESFATYLEGCEKWGIRPVELKDGKPKSAKYYEPGRVRLVKSRGVTPNPYHHNVKLGAKIKDTITSFEGIVTIKSEYCFGADRVGVECEFKDNEWVDAQWFDACQLEILSPVEKKKTEKVTGGGADPQPKEGI